MPEIHAMRRRAEYPSILENHVSRERVGRLLGYPSRYATRCRIVTAADVGRLRKHSEKLSLLSYLCLVTAGYLEQYTTPPSCRFLSSEVQREIQEDLEWLHG